MPDLRAKITASRFDYLTKVIINANFNHVNTRESM